MQLSLAIMMSKVVGAATMVSIPATVDGYVQFSGALGFSTSATGNDEIFIDTTMSGGSNVRHGIYEFDLSDVPDGATITAATFQLTTARFISNTGGNPAPISIYGYTGDGVVATTDYDAAAPTIAFQSLPLSTATGTTINFAFTDLSQVNAANDSAGDVFGVGSKTVSFVSFRIASLENESFAPPTLLLTYVPEAGTVGLMLLGMAGLLGRRSRR